jgi:hypothetical protein
VLSALDPRARSSSAAQASSRALELLAVHAGLRARHASREAAAALLIAHVGETRTRERLALRTQLRPAHSEAWDDSACCAFAYALRLGADGVRASLPSPFEA